MNVNNTPKISPPLTESQIEEITPHPTTTPSDDTKGILPLETSFDTHIDLLKMKVVNQREAAFEKGDDTQVEKLEALLSQLENGEDIGLRAFELQELFEVYSENGIECAKSGVEFLESVLPKSITEHGPLEEIFVISSKVAVLGAALTVAINVGAGLGILYYKQKILDESRLALTNARAKINDLKSDPKISKEELAQTERVLKEWGAAINAETKEINHEMTIMSGKSIAKTVSALGELGGITLQGANAVAGATAISSSALAVYAYFEMKEKIENNQVFSRWQADFSTWQQNIIPRFTGTLNLSEADLEKLKTDSIEEPQTEESLVGSTYTNTINLFQLERAGTVSEEEITALEKDFEKNEKIVRSTLRQYFSNTVAEAPKFPNQRLVDFLTATKFLQSGKLFHIDEVTKFRNDLKQGVINLNYDTWFEGANKRELIKLHLIHQKLTHSGVNPTEDLLAKRQEVRSKKVDELTPKFDEKKDQLRTTLKSFYRETLQGALQPDGEIEHYLIKLKLSAIPLDKESIAAGEFDIKERLDDLDRSYNEWFDQLSSTEEGKQALLELYVDKHQTIEQTLKHSLREVVDHKLKIENQFVKLSLIDAKVSFGVATTCAVISIALLITGLATLPLGGAGALLLLVGAAPAAVAMSFFFAELILSFRKKPKTTLALYKGLSFKLITNRLIKGIAVKRMGARSQVVKAESEVVANLQGRLNVTSTSENRREFQQVSSQLQSALYNLDKAKHALDSSEKTAKRWSERTERLEKKLGHLAWQDFAKNASLVVNSHPEGFIGPTMHLDHFDSLTAFKEALEQCDFDLISEETRYILETQLGLNISELQTFLRDESENKDWVGFVLQKFTALKQDEVIKLIRRQRARMALDLIPQSEPTVVNST